ncbi:type I polyketide synthase [Streptomyces abikoensis]|uniref:Type I polyketide synthase n=1 Tax=Streptomyces abikoensis TaxID=97398 RepID=A0ABW7SXB5_9ACTN
MKNQQAISDELRDRLAGQPRDRQDRILLDLVRAHVVSVLGGGLPSKVPGRKPFREMGVRRESRDALLQALSRATGVALPSTLFFDHPNPLSVARYLRQQLMGTFAQFASVAGDRPSDRGEPIAIVGMACRYGGGVSSPEDLWDLVESGGDAVGSFPVDRGWDLAGLYDPDPDRAGTSYTRAGAFLEDIAGFDAGFFGISPREAQVLDPQQRLLLETSWEVLERAGIDPQRMDGTTTGVFIGTNYQDYRFTFDGIPESSEGYVITGNAGSVLSGRLAYVLGLQGPAVTVDTACSSSLVALHQACQALRAGECDMAITGGAALMSSPEAFVEFSRKRALSADGRCKAFAEGADGTGWGEGVGVLLVERLSDARRNGRRVLAVVRGSAVNHNGASNGLTAPHGPSQERVIRAALAQAGLSVSEVDAVEAHGTGTRLGDPIEAQALLATYGRERAGGEPLWLGSVKSNIAHTQAASGVAGVIKMVMAMERGLLPRTLHVDEPSSHVDWSAGSVRLLTETRRWPETDRPRRAGVSSFGVSGTNAHVVLEHVPEEPAEAGGEAQGDAGTSLSMVPLPVSGRTQPALRAQAARLLTRLRDDPSLDVAKAGAALTMARSVFEHRAVVVGEDRAELLRGLDALAHGEPAPQVVEGVVSEADAAPVFVFPGGGSQWVGMGRELLRNSPVFAESMRMCSSALEPWVEWKLTEVLDDEAALARVDVIQPVLWSVMVSLARVWRGYGIEPAAVIGHSQGEIAAACVAGVLSVEDAARVVALRSRALVDIAGEGGMVSAMAPAQQVGEVIAAWGQRLAIAAVNGPAAVAVSGDDDALTALEEEFLARQVVHRRIPGVDFSAHSPHIDRLAGTLHRALADVRPTTARIPFFSTVDVQWLSGPEMDGGYWFRNLRQTVRFAESVRALAVAGHTTFIEVSPHSVLTTALEQNLDDIGEQTSVTATLQRGEGGLRRLYTSLAEAFVAGMPVDWSPAFADVPHGGVDLPLYPFQRQRYWPEPRTNTVTGTTSSSAQSAAEGTFWAAVEDEDAEALTAALGDAAEAAPSWRTVLPALASWRRRDRAQSVFDDLRYRIDWSPADFAAAGLTGPWLAILPDTHGDDAWTNEVQDGLARGGAVLLPLTVPGTVRREELLDELRGILDATGLRSSDVSGVVSLLALDETPLPERPGVPAGTAGTLALIQALGDAGLETPLWLLTRGAVSVGGTDPLTRPLQALAWGLGRVVGLEHPQRWGGLVDLPQSLDEQALNRLVRVLGAGTGEDHVAVRGTGTFVRRLVRAPLGAGADRAGQSPWNPRPDTTVLITGGTGVQAGHVARWLARKGAGHLLLLSRQGADAPGAAERVAELEELGAKVTVVACDVRDRKALSDVLAAIPADLPLSAVVHTAGIGRLQPLPDTSLVDFAEVMEAKAVGARHLHELTREVDLDAFVLYSAISATWGVGRHGSYGAANTYLEALAQHRRTQGLTATAVAWGGWAGDGMAIRDASEDTLLRRGLPWGAWDEAGMTMQEAADETLHRWGVHVMEPELLLTALQQILDADETLVTVANMDWPTFVAGFTMARRRPLLDGLPEAREAAAALDTPTGGRGGAPEESESLRERLATASRHEQDRLLLEAVRFQVAAVLGHDSPEAVEAGHTFLTMGLDSVTAVQLRNKLGSATGLRLPATVVFDHPTVTDLVAFLRTQLIEKEPDAVQRTLTEIDELEESLSRHSYGDDERLGIATRLRALAQNLEGHDRSADGGDGASDLESAGISEMFSILDNELDAL